MTLSTQPYKGARDFYPADERLQKYMFGKMREVCERFGYEEYDAPILEPTELYLSKGNEEIIAEQTYSFTDRGGRNVTMRTEMTPTVSRMVAARRQESAYPLRLYSIPQCWRYERMQRGRGREFYQLNVDIFGVADIAADFEMVQVADAIMQSYGAKRNTYDIKINSRKLMDDLLTRQLGFDETQAQTVRVLIDRMKKMDPAVFTAQLDAVCSPSQREAGKDKQLLNFLQLTALDDIPEAMSNHPSVMELRQLGDMLQAAGVSNVTYDPTLMRGFEYYTDIAFEVFDTDPENNRSMFGGGRYDGLVALFGVDPLPSAGFAMGDITLKNFLEAHGLVPPLPPETDLYVVLAGDVLAAAQKPIAELRGMDVNVAVDFSGRKVGDQIKAADKKGIAYVLVIGESELSDGHFTLKNLQTGVEEKHGLERIVSIVSDRRQQPAEEEL